MTPLHINLMLHYYAIAEPYAKDNRSHRESPAVIEYTQELVNLRMLQPDPEGPSGYICTERGQVYINALRAVPLPEAKLVWTIPA